MKIRVLVLSLALAFQQQPALAGGGMTGGATEVTQIINMVQLVQSYGQQVMDYAQQLQQYQTMIRNLARNPMGVLAPDLQKLVQDQAKLMAVGKDIASSMSKVDMDFAKTFKSTIAADFATKFKDWSNTSTDALKAAMLNAGLHRENFKSDGEALQKLVDSVSAADGAVGALQALGSLNAAQIQEGMKLRDLISQQQVAQNTYLASQNAKEQAREERGAAIAGTLAPMAATTFKKAYTPLKVLNNSK